MIDLLRQKCFALIVAGNITTGRAQLKILIGMNLLEYLVSCEIYLRSKMDNIVHYSSPNDPRYKNSLRVTTTGSQRVPMLMTEILVCLLIGTIILISIISFYMYQKEDQE